MQNMYSVATGAEKVKSEALKKKLEAKLKRAKTIAQKAIAEREAMDNSMQ